VDPHTIMRRTERTALGLGCIAGGCAALVWMLTTPALFSSWNGLSNTLLAAEATSPEADDTSTTALTTATDAIHEADLAPQARVVIPPGRPEWVEADFSHEQGDTQRVAVSSGPYKRKHDATRSLNEEIVKATRTYIGEYLGSSAAETLIPVDAATIRRELVQGNLYDERITVSELGPMFQTHALIEFGPEFRQKIEERWKTIVVTGRVARLGVIGLGVLMMLSVVMGYFKADNATRGYYTTRLQMGTAGALVALVAGGVMLLRYL
jgi:hypothetical protein